MDKNNEKDIQTTENSSRQASAKNPFENNQSVEQDIAQSQEKIDKEQEFKEAQTERD